MTRLLVIALVVTQLTACSGMLRDRRDAPWDTFTTHKPILEQLPNWEHPYGNKPCYDPRGCKSS
jgi:hypothetical protein